MNIQKITIFTLFSMLAMALCAEIKPNNKQLISQSETSIVIASSTSGDSFIKIIAQAYSKANVEVKLKLNKVPPGKAVKLLKQCKADIAITTSSTDLKPAMTLLKPYVTAVNKQNPLENISFTRLRKIYAGKIKLWSELGGQKVPIKLVDYKLKDPNKESMLLHKILKVPPAKHRFMLESSNGRGIAALIASQQDTIGCFPLELYSRKVKILKINGVYPGNKDIRDGKYKLVASIKVLQSKSESKKTQKFIEFLKSKKADQVYKYLSLYRK